MKPNTAKNLLLATTVAAAMTLPGSNAMAQDADALQIFGDASSTAVTYNGSGSVAAPIVTAVLSVPGATVNGKTYSASSGTFLAADSTGSMEIYGTPAGTYTPNVGDQLSISGTYSPYHQVPEIETITGVSVQSTGNAAPAGAGAIASPIITSIPAVNVSTLPQNLAGQWLQLDGVTISDTGAGDSTLPVSGNYGTGNLQLTITDGQGNSMVFYYYPGDYSLANQNLFGQAIITGQPVDLAGIASVYPTGSVAEYLGMQITPLPEPSTYGLAAGGALVLWALRRRIV